MHVHVHVCTFQLMYKIPGLARIVCVCVCVCVCVYRTLMYNSLYSSVVCVCVCEHMFTGTLMYNNSWFSVATDRYVQWYVYCVCVRVYACVHVYRYNHARLV